MPYGTGPLIRTALLKAKPWQRYLLAVVMVAGGVGLVLVGHLAGVVPAAAGVLLLVRMVRFRLARRHRAASLPVGGVRTGPTGRSPRSGGGPR